MCNIRKIGIWGVGNHVLKNILPSIVQSDIKIAGIWTRNEKTQKIISEKYEIKIFKSERDFLSSTEIDIVYLATPNGIHFSQAKKIAVSNKHLICEKSIVTNIEQGEELVKLFRNKGKLLVEAFMYKYHNQFSKIKKIINENKIGKIVTVNAKFGFPHLSGDNIRYDKNLGGGALLDNGCYPVSFALELLDQEPLKIKSLLTYDNKNEIDVEGVALLEFKNKTKCILEWGFGKFYRNEVVIWGSTGYLVIERPFTKPGDLITKIFLSNEYGDDIIYAEEENHFVSMFHQLIKDVREKSFDYHYKAILRQSKVINNIFLDAFS